MYLLLYINIKQTTKTIKCTSTYISCNPLFIITCIYINIKFTHTLQECCLLYFLFTQIDLDERFHYIWFWNVVERHLLLHILSIVHGRHHKCISRTFTQMSFPQYFACLCVCVCVCIVTYHCNKSPLPCTSFRFYSILLIVYRMHYALLFVRFSFGIKTLHILSVSFDMLSIIWWDSR